jgi:hypothetical protein
MIRLGLLVVVVGVALWLFWGRSAPSGEQARLEEGFAKAMTDVVLAGKFQIGDRVVDDRYAVKKASKLVGDSWIIQAQWGKKDLTIPVPVTVKWAGDTPVITLTDAGIPGVGTYTARVLIYRDHYAGYWANDKGHGGQMWGKLERPAAPAMGQ